MDRFRREVLALFFLLLLVNPPNRSYPAPNRSYKHSFRISHAAATYVRDWNMNGGNEQRAPSRSLQQTQPAAATSSPSMLTQCPTMKGSLLGANFSAERCCLRGMESLNGQQGICSKPCLRGQTMTSGSDTCTSCPIGTTSNGFTGSCMECPRGTSTAPRIGIYECIPCPDGTLDSSSFKDDFMAQAGSSYAGAELSPCVECPAGFSSTQAVGTQQCSPCVEGAISVVSAGTFGGGKLLPFLTVKAATCKMCGDGTYADSISNTCQPCPSGTYSNGAVGIKTDRCTPCAAGTLATKTGSTVCTPPCPCKYKWTDGCDQLANDASEEFQVYLSYVKAGLSLPVANGVMCVLEMVLRDPRHASKMEQLLTIMQDTANSSSVVQPDASLLETAKLLRNIQNRTLDTTPFVTDMKMDRIDSTLTTMGSEINAIFALEVKADLLSLLNKGFLALQNNMREGFNMLKRTTMAAFEASQNQIKSIADSEYFNAASVASALDVRFNEMSNQRDNLLEKLTEAEQKVPKAQQEFQTAMYVQMAFNILKAIIDVVMALMNVFNPTELNKATNEYATTIQGNAKKIETVFKVANIFEAVSGLLDNLREIARKSSWLSRRRTIRSRSPRPEFSVDRAKEANETLYQALLSSTGHARLKKDLETVGIQQDAIVNGPCVNGGAGVIGPCEALRGAMRSVIQIKLAINDIDKSMADNTVEWARNEMKSQSALARSDQYGTAIKGFLEAQDAAVDISSFDPLYQAALALAIQHNFTLAARRIQSSMDVIRAILSKCALMRLSYPALYSDPLCGVTPSNLRPDSEFLINAMEEIKTVEASKVADVTSELAAIGIDLPLVNISSSIPGLPINLDSFRKSRSATFALDQQQVAWLINGTTKWSSLARTRARLRVKDIRVVLRGAKLLNTRACSSSSLSVSITLNSPFKLRHVDTTTKPATDVVNQYDLPPVGTTYKYATGEDCGDADVSDRFFVPGSKEVFCDILKGSWMGTEQPPMFATWAIAVKNPCVDLSAMDGFFLTVTLTGKVGLPTIAKPGLILPVNGTEPDAIARMGWAEYNVSCAEFNQTLCSLTQLCSNSTFTREVQENFSIPLRSEPTFVALRSQTGEAGTWTLLTNTTGFCEPIALPDSSPKLSSTRLRLCCS